LLKAIQRGIRFAHQGIEAGEIVGHEHFAFIEQRRPIDPGRGTFRRALLILTLTPLRYQRGPTLWQ
jgi:hypothetical protein